MNSNFPTVHSALDYMVYPDGSFGFKLPNITVEQLDLIRRSKRKLEKLRRRSIYSTNPTDQIKTV